MKFKEYRRFKKLQKIQKIIKNLKLTISLKILQKFKNSKKI